MMKGTGSDYIKAKKQQAIYENTKSNALLTGNTVNPKKKDGYYYNNMLNVCVPSICDNSSGCSGGVLTNTKSYQMRMDFTQGKHYNQYVCNCSKKKIEEATEEGCEIIEIKPN